MLTGLLQNQEDPDQHQTSSRAMRTRSMVTTEEASQDAPRTDSIPDLLVCYTMGFIPSTPVMPLN